MSVDTLGIDPQTIEFWESQFPRETAPTSPEVLAGMASGIADTEAAFSALPSQERGKLNQVLAAKRTGATEGSYKYNAD